ncbi:hypothetical protein [Aeromonas sp.]|uniref:hypothetical protein n=1 Tax=Aeromonas sp. TaxID=647 RepID=UPI00258ECFCC|nr:hypothetical protein [Aeromonas sp.]MCX7127747.1 hypothetical protein [Aeromonas sp.]
MNAIYILSFLICFMNASVAYAVVVKVNAEYAQSLSDPSKNEFRITDPCIVNKWVPELCNETLSRVVSVDADIVRLFNSNGSLSNRRFYHSVKEPRRIQLINRDGNSVDFIFLITHTGFTQLSSDNYPGSSTAPADALSDCKLIGEDSWSSSSRKFSLLLYEMKDSTQRKGGRCFSKPWVYSIYHQARLQKIYFGFRLVPVSTTSISNGTYKGSLLLSVGSGGDFDYGNYSHSSPDSVQLEFSLIVRNQLKVEFPAGSNKIILQPKGGWSELSHRSNKYVSHNLSAVLPARFSTTVPYNVSLQCQHYAATGNSCQLKNKKNEHKVSVDVYGTGNFYNKIVIPVGSKYKFTSPSELRDVSRPFYFEVNKNEVNKMMAYPGSTYQGDITIIIEAAPP